MPLYIRILKSEINKIITSENTNLSALLDSNKDLDNEFKNYIKDELEKWVNKNKNRIIEEYKELLEEDEIEMDLIDSDELLMEFTEVDNIKKTIDNFVDGLEQDVNMVYSNAVDRIFTNYYNEYINDIKKTLKDSTKISNFKTAVNETSFTTKLEESTELSQKMNKLLLNKLDTFLDGKSDDWTIDSNPDVETILDDFIKETVTSEFVFDKFEVELSDMAIDKLCDYVYNNFDDLYDETDSRIEDELSNRDDTKSPFGPGMGQSDFI